MGHKKGFSLIELLLVMVMLALFVILVYPRILNSYKSAKKNSFLTEAKTVYKESNKKYASKKMDNVDINTITESNENSLELSNSTLKYCVKLDKKGIVNLKVTNGEFYIEGENDFLAASKIKDVNYGKFDKFDCDYVLDKKDLLEDFDIEQITNTKKYSTTLKCLWISFGAIIVIGIFAKKRNER